MRTRSFSSRPNLFSIRRNCTLWNPEAGSNMERKSRKSSGVIVSRMSN